MKKIISLFQREIGHGGLVRDEVTPGAEWVIRGEGIATQKHDGTCCLIEGGKLFKRYTLKKDKIAPADFVPATEIDLNTGKQEGWVPVGDGPDDKWHREAFVTDEKDGTYELCGPKVQGNPEDYDTHILISHGSIRVKDVLGILEDPPRTYSELHEWFSEGKCIEGIVWHHSDGRMVKIKAKDFGCKREES